MRTSSEFAFLLVENYSMTTPSEPCACEGIFGLKKLLGREFFLHCGFSCLRGSRRRRAGRIGDGFGVARALAEFFLAIWKKFCDRSYAFEAVLLRSVSSLFHCGYPQRGSKILIEQKIQSRDKLLSELYKIGKCRQHFSDLGIEIKEHFTSEILF